MLHRPRTVHVVVIFIVLIPFSAGGFAQDLNSLPPSSQEQWKVFVDETESPLLPGAAFFNATTSQLTRSIPHYGGEAGGYVKRFVASAADDTAQNFFGDYVMASLLHEDTRYRRAGPGHSFPRRVAHAAFSGLVARNFSGGRTVNWSNITGSAIGAAISNAYYPAVDRSASITASNFAQNVIGAGLGNLAPEFWPDFHHWLKRHHLFPSQTK
jgi:hypothetical protein